MWNDWLDPLTLSLEFLERKRRERIPREAEERAWPSEVIEDVLDADEVSESPRFQPNPIIGIDKMI